VREGEGVAAQVLTLLGGDLTRVRQSVMVLLSGHGESTEGMPGPQAGPSSRRFTSSGVRRRAGIVGCSFCGRKPPDSGQLVAGTDAFICEHCIRHWAGELQPTEAGLDILRAAEGEKGGLEGEGSPPEDEDGGLATDG